MKAKPIETAPRGRTVLIGKEYELSDGETEWEWVTAYISHFKQLMIDSPFKEQSERDLDEPTHWCELPEVD